MKPRLMTAAEAATHLQVSRRTLYAYVSRGVLRSVPSNTDARTRLYVRSEVEQLRRANLERAPGDAALHALNWGLPVLQTGLSYVKESRLYYRGIDVVELSRGRTFEQVSSFLITGKHKAERLVFSGPSPALPDTLVSQLPVAARIITALQGNPGSSVPPEIGNLTRLLQTAGDVIRTCAQAAARRGLERSIAATLAAAWNIPSGVIDAILILCSDHELNSSSFAARCAASTWSSLYNAATVGVAVLAGQRHSGITYQAYDLLHSIRDRTDSRTVIRGFRALRDSLAGFGHPLYPSGDPRGAEVLRLALALPRVDQTKSALLSDFVEAVREQYGIHPNLDFSLAAFAYLAELDSDAAFILFCVGRCAGWMAHAIEQYRDPKIIRPRASAPD